MIIEQAQNIAWNVLRSHKVKNSLQISRSIIGEIVKEEKRRLKMNVQNKSVKTYLEFLNETFNPFPITYDELVSKTRKREVVDCRHFIGFALYEIDKLSYKAAGALLGGRDHSTIINSKNMVNDMADVDRRWENTRTTMLAMFKKDVNEIKL